MDLRDKRRKLAGIYERFETDAKPFKENAICRPGCAFCCTHFGNVDITTLEGLLIANHVRETPPKIRKALRKKIAANKKDRESGKAPVCPFLKRDKTCLVYEVRPFSCRRLYSVAKCEGRGPTVHRGAMELAELTVLRLQELDSTGYSGHMTFILHLLEQPDFRDLYVSGGFDPTRIVDYGRPRGLIVNCANVRG